MSLQTAHCCVHANSCRKIIGWRRDLTRCVTSDAERRNAIDLERSTTSHSLRSTRTGGILPAFNLEAQLGKNGLTTVTTWPSCDFFIALAVPIRGEWLMSRASLPSTYIKGLLWFISTIKGFIRSIASMRLWATRKLFRQGCRLVNDGRLRLLPLLSCSQNTSNRPGEETLRFCR